MIQEIETRSQSEIDKLQNKLLIKLMRYVSENSRFYQRKFASEGIEIDTIKNVSDLQKISPTTKDDLQQHNDDFLCVDACEIRDYCTTSGTLGEPVSFGLTDRDLDRLAYNEWMSFERVGVKSGDKVQLTTTMDRRFMAGIAYFLGLRKIGAGVIRVGAGVPPLQWDSILRYQPKFLIAVPSFLLKLIDYAEKNDIDYRQSSVKGVICIGEALRNPDLTPTTLASKILEKWPLKLFSTYASTEMGAAFTECDAFNGGHFSPELIITEILDEHDQPVDEGKLGELVVTTLDIEGMPLIRFKTGDMVRRHIAPCACGRTTYRIGPVEGRKQQMIKYKGTTLYPPAMHDAIAHFDEIKLHLIEISRNEIGTDEILIRFYSTDNSEEFISRVKDYFRAKLRVSPHFVFDEESELQRIIHNPNSRKPVTLIDYRK